MPAEVVRVGFNLSVCYTLGYVAEIPSQHTSDPRKLGYDVKFVAVAITQCLVLQLKETREMALGIRSCTSPGQDLCQYSASGK